MDKNLRTQKYNYSKLIKKYAYSKMKFEFKKITQ